MSGTRSGGSIHDLRGYDLNDQTRLSGGESVPLTSTATGISVGTCQPGLVVDGMLRVYVTSQCRQATTRTPARETRSAFPP
ncbi:hypothetical protein [Streptomyces venetus]|uniref:hypothetical protein n=1 Tax=Streptomyces venetus TaxID=1701086 RepID=UPI003C2D34B5